jgi:hypothetical protein
LELAAISFPLCSCPQTASFATGSQLREPGAVSSRRRNSRAERRVCPIEIVAVAFRRSSVGPEYLTPLRPNPGPTRGRTFRLNPAPLRRVSFSRNASRTWIGRDAR